MLNTEHWQTYALSLSNNAIRHVFTLFFLISSTFWFKSSLKSLAKIALLALPLLSYSWQLQAANGSNNRTKRSDAIIMPSQAISYARPNLFYSYSLIGSATLIHTTFLRGKVNLSQLKKEQI
ncbi:hypothetical protein A9G35_06225 [Gilliamella sp. Choc5-1]|uniref:hypothetical protein n=1 Tax=Gilliamella sp. Choc5-1 TaxID=3120238 RepID=UPI00080DC317|nr:hypothetical protein [Gilliamella apicola]OCG45569.1 hypothetical protein A9G35_06225 [Gilliamella apicola]